MSRSQRSTDRSSASSPSCSSRRPPSHRSKGSRARSSCSGAARSRSRSGACSTATQQYGATTPTTVGRTSPGPPAQSSRCSRPPPSSSGSTTPYGPRHPGSNYQATEPERAVLLVSLAASVVSLGVALHGFLGGHREVGAIGIACAAVDAVAMSLRGRNAILTAERASLELDTALASDGARPGQAPSRQRPARGAARRATNAQADLGPMGSTFSMTAARDGYESSSSVQAATSRRSRRSIATDAFRSKCRAARRRPRAPASAVSPASTDPRQRC